MPVTSADYFTTASQTSTGLPSWSDLNNILGAAGDSRATAPSTADVDSETITLDTPLSGSEVPASHDITNIRIIVNCVRIDASGTKRINGLNIAGGSDKTSFIGDTQEDEIFDGDLAYWGITQEQAKDFAAGTENLEFYCSWTSQSSSGHWIEIFYVTAQFTHEPAQVNLPAIF